MYEALEIKLQNARDLLEQAVDLLWVVDGQENNWNNKCVEWLLELDKWNNNG